MNNLINLNSIISNLNFSDNKPVLQLSEISAELLEAIKFYKSGMLEAFAKADGGFEFVLQLGDNAFPINLKSNLFEQILTDEKVSLPVKLNSSGQITIVNDVAEKVNNLPKPDVVVEIKENSLFKPTLTPIKLQNFVEQIEHQNFEGQNIKDIPTLVSVKQQILQIAGDINVSLNSLGKQISNNVNVKNLQNVIKEIINNPQNFNELKVKLEQVVESLPGKQLLGEISNKINQLYVIKTPLGETYFSSDIKIPISQEVVLDINSLSPSFDEKVKLVSDVLKKVLPEFKTLSDHDIKIVIKENGFQHIAEILQNVDTKIIDMLITKLPLQKDNLLENIYNLYKGVVAKDITQWIGAENVKELISDNVNVQKNVADLNKVMQNFVKETPSWRIIEMPFFDGSLLSSIKIALKKDKQQKEKFKKEKTTRFIVETEFSKLGKFQFDGFSKAQSRSFDLIIRTSFKISDDFCLNIINLFKKSLYDLDYSGNIKINKAENFVNFNEEVIVTEGVYI